MGKQDQTIITPEPPPDGPPPGFTFAEGSEAAQEAMADFQAPDADQPPDEDLTQRDEEVQGAEAGAEAVPPMMLEVPLEVLDGDGTPVE